MNPLRPTRLLATCAVITGIMFAAGCASSRQSADEAVAQKEEKTETERSKRRSNVITADEIQKRPGATLADLIKGRITGVYGAGGESLQIRGPSSIYGSNEPLYVLDGVPLVSLPNINTYDIETIEVLKGPDAAIYGVRGANGVIIITTKRQN